MMVICDYINVCYDNVVVWVYGLNMAYLAIECTYVILCKKNDGKDLEFKFSFVLLL